VRAPIPLLLATSVLTALVGGCATSHRDRAWLDDELRARLGEGTRGAEASELPGDATLEDGIDEREVVRLTLWRSPSLAAELTRIDAARATLDEASRPANPQLNIMGPIGPITAVATLLVPLESLWQLPQRTEASARDADAVAESVLMRALDLVRDARLLHAELGLAEDRHTVRAELSAVGAELARLGEVRARVGETSLLDASVLAADARAALDAEDAARTERENARARLAAALALESEGLVARFTNDEVPVEIALDQLLLVARSSRPDVRSAEQALAAAAARSGWERSRVLALGALVEGQWSEAVGPALRLGARVDIPLFGTNPGGIGRADAEVARAAAQLEVMRQTVTLEVTVARARLLQAARSREAFEGEVLVSLDEALRVATSAFESGEETYLVVLDVLRRSAEARLRHADLVAEARRARAELERAIGARLEESPP
jgi:cobalt-zinc-cadmium efflux system outer membrane protein